MTVNTTIVLSYLNSLKIVVVQGSLQNSKAHCLRYLDEKVSKLLRRAYVPTSHEVRPTDTSHAIICRMNNALQLSSSPERFLKYALFVRR